MREPTNKQRIKVSSLQTVIKVINQKEQWMKTHKQFTKNNTPIKENNHRSEKNGPIIVWDWHTPSKLNVQGVSMINVANKEIAYRSIQTLLAVINIIIYLQT